MLLTGPNGAGKTNLLEALHVGTQGFSPRTRSDARLIRFGAAGARVRLSGLRDDAPFESEVVLRADEPRRVSLNGDTLSSSERLRHTFRTLVFTPDRLAVVKGGPAVRRAYLDRMLERLFPGRAAVPGDYASALAQRNAALRRVVAGASGRDALGPWTEAVAERGGALVAARTEAASLVATTFAHCADRIGLAAASLAYEGEPATVAEYEGDLERDLERGVTTRGPHLHDLSVTAGGRDLRAYGSQGEQRTAVLALVLAEAAVLKERSGASPLVLLDDVLSELDSTRRRALAEWLQGDAQTLVTATAAGALPLEPSQSLVISRGGEVRPG